MAGIPSLGNFLGSLCFGILGFLSLFPARTALASRGYQIPPALGSAFRSKKIGNFFPVSSSVLPGFHPSGFKQRVESSPGEFLRNIRKVLEFLPG